MKRRPYQYTFNRYTIKAGQSFPVKLVNCNGYGIFPNISLWLSYVYGVTGCPLNAGNSYFFGNKDEVINTTIYITYTVPPYLNIVQRAYGEVVVMTKQYI